MKQSSSTGNTRWYPSHDQLKDVDATHRAFKQLLDQHYALVDQVNGMSAAKAAPASVNAGETKTAAAPPGSGPVDTMLLGLRVAPVDSQTLANGATLKYDKASGNFKFS